MNLKSRFGRCSESLAVWSTEQLCSPLPTVPLPPVPSDLEMADDFEGGDVDLLIGLDHLYRIVLWEQLELSEGLRAIETIFGYVLHGYHDGGKRGTPQHRCFHSRQVESMWDLDTVGIRVGEISEKDPSSYLQPVWDEEENRYQMGLVWMSEERPVSNEGGTRVRTTRMTDRLNKEQKNDDDGQIMGMLNDAVIELSPPKEDQIRTELQDPSEQGNKSLPGPRDGTREPKSRSEDRCGMASTSAGFFLPHHGVRKRNKLRVVFDGSAKDGIGRSLNEYLDQGDNLLAKLPSVLLNFRSGTIGCQADIQAAFHQVAVCKRDRKYLQFFWSGLCLRFARVPFGLTCSPFMLLKTVIVHLSKYEESDQDLCGLIQSGIYMDDICLHFGTKEEADLGMSRTREIFADANMKLHKVRMTGDHSPAASVLGLAWDTQNDQLAVVIPEFPCPSTKSELLSAVAKTFDPLGLLTPWLIGGKILFQRTWKDMPDANWDDPVNDEIQVAIKSWWRDSTNQAVFFPRPLTSESPTAVWHVFCDASERAYCAAIYVVSGEESRLVTAEGRLAPLRPGLTIPRLELMAAVIGARLMTFIKESLHLENPTVTYWTDSTDVLYWIRNQKQRKIFVHNRVSTIRQLTEPERWNYVKGTENPADLGTRGISVQTMKTSRSWWAGPPFLTQVSDPSCTDGQLKLELSSEAQREDRSETPSRGMAPAKIMLNTQEEGVCLFDITECSSLQMVVNKTAWVSRFICNARKARPDRLTGPLSSEERCKALEFWIREAQSRAYIAELKSLRAKTLLPKGSALTKLKPRLNENGVLCAVPRTGEELLPVLPEFAHITTLLIDEAHRRCFHQGTRSTLAILSADYLVRRRSVLRVVGTCRRCRRYRGMPYRASDGGLPSFRVEPSRAFAKVGLDFFGPLLTSTGSKTWVLLITCATSRAVHLELVRSQSTDEVKLALRRFFALRGTPSLIYSDNAKTFRAMLHHIPRCVTWRFIPEAAPWWGGFWERMVGVTKRCLKITVHLCNLAHDELAATLYELAFHLNMRPLTDVDKELITPAHLLFGVTSIRGVLSPPRVYLDIVTRAWRHQRRVSDHLIRRWTSEYIAALRCWSVSPRGRPKHTPAVDDVVLVHNEGPRGHWPIARIVALIYGSGGQPRAARIRMRGVETRRPLSKLFRLEAAS